MKAKTRKVVTGVCALVLTAAVSIAGTIAYLTKTTEYRANNFTFASRAVNAMLTEPYWDSVIDYYYEDDNGKWVIHPIYDYIDKTPGDAPDGNGKVNDDETVYGYMDGDRTKPIKHTPKELAEWRKTAGNNSFESYDDLPNGFGKVLEEFWDDSEETWKYPSDYEEDEEKQNQPFDPWELYKPPTEYPEEKTVYDDRYHPEDENGEKLLDSNDDGEKDDLGRLAAQLMVPGRVANKNPFVTNTGTSAEWIAVKVSFVYSEIAGKDADDKSKAGKVLSDEDYDLVRKIIRINWNENVIGGEIQGGKLKNALSLGEEGADENKWLTLDYSTAQSKSKETLFGADTKSIDIYPDSADYLFTAKQTVFYYTTPLEARERTSLWNLDTTVPIFTTVTVDENASTEDIEALEKIGGFAIYIEGFAIQKEAFTDGNVWANDICAAKNARTAKFGSDSLTFEPSGSLYEGRSVQYIDGDTDDNRTVDQPGIKPSPDGPGEKVEVIDETNPPKE